ncbi:FAD-binding oxidoreductase [Sphingomonadales bacterium 56]|uniref:FAD-binding oxidoreductase n=1 Tax=Sphingobium agri TaxID=2933566 RepID=A0ABT0DZW2_9SPHN|nr:MULTISPECIES: FAD-binding oxidoreductase [Sphingobium]MBY2929993.1 FAD-binding oxidoreductase [Sphingomonadales bacterium 56]MBY2959758.1 FAD-binding oxidoreductase [Sphingomonadales bacterium 58]MCK0532608.1 FAD-binding oxidoreductase [Sphingobium agri]CAD7339761.1 Monomeric sarcosine oxidase [Sphingobium sp. S8]CAD7340545.1 Monomeric sarcosine oxidase [Sphingobium sp. S6]
MTRPRIAIIGAGTAGCGAALRAAELGADVIVLERDAPASGSSGRSAGVYNYQTLNPLDIEIRIRAKELFLRLERERELPLAKIGNVRVAYTDEHMDRLAEAVKVQRELGGMDSRLIDREGLRQLVPDMRVDDLAGGLFGPTDGHLDGYLLCTTLLEEAKEKGARVSVQTDVLSHSKTGRVHRLETSKGLVEADIVINAAGAWAGNVGKLLGHAVPIKPQVHEVFLVRLPRELDYTVPMVNLYMPGQEGEGLYFRQDGPDSLIAGLHTYEAIDGLDVDPDSFSPPSGDDHLITVATLLTERMGMDDFGFSNGWFGLYPISMDDRFQVGPYEADPSVLVVGGLGGVGVTSGSILGMCVAEWAISGKPATVPGVEELRPDRPSLSSFR